MRTGPSPEAMVSSRPPSAARTTASPARRAVAFAALFRQATGHRPYPYQRRLAAASALPHLLRIPAGCGRDAAAVLGWVWFRRFHPDPAVRRETPRRLILCLPGGALVDALQDEVTGWLDALDLLAGTRRPREEWPRYAPAWGDPRRIPVAVFRDAPSDSEFRLHPERDAVLIGTAPRLLPRALAPRPGVGLAECGLLQADALWVVKEPGLSPAATPTIAQLQAFRRLLGTPRPSATLWVGTALDDGALRTADGDPLCDLARVLALGPSDRSDARLGLLLRARKPLRRARATADDARRLAREVALVHRGGTRTLVIANAIGGAEGLHEAIRGALPDARVVLVHPLLGPRALAAAAASLAEVPEDAGTIGVMGGGAEASIGVSATTLVTEIAPWPVLVERFARCNREGRDLHPSVVWVDAPTDPGRIDGQAHSFDPEDLGRARRVLARLSDVGPGRLPAVPADPFRPHVLRRRDLLSLFAAAPKRGDDVPDLSRFVTGPWWRGESVDRVPAEDADAGPEGAPGASAVPDAVERLARRLGLAPADRAALRAAALREPGRARRPDPDLLHHPGVGPFRLAYFEALLHAARARAAGGGP